jgi:hypothetical protein
MGKSTFNGHTHVRLGELTEDTEFLYKGKRYRVTGVSKYQRVSKTTGSVQVQRTDYMTPRYGRKRWTLLARTAILRSEVFYISS